MILPGAAFQQAQHDSKPEFNTQLTEHFLLTVTQNKVPPALQQGVLYLEKILISG